MSPEIFRTRVRAVADNLATAGEHCFPARHHTDVAGLHEDRDVAKAAAQLGGWALGTFATQRDHDGRVAIHAVLFSGPDDLASRLPHRASGSD